MAGSERNKPDEPIDVILAGFTEDEWIASSALLEGQSTATERMRSMFADIRAAGSNGWALSSTRWALLSLVNEDCQRRVRDSMEEFPADFVKDVWLQADEFGRALAEGTLESSYQAALTKWRASTEED